MEIEAIPLARHHSVTRKCEATRALTAPVNIPELIGTSSVPWPRADLEDRVVEMDEWLNLAMLQSPRIQHTDEIDPYLCRYSKPLGDSSKIENLVRLRWSGFIPATWLRHLFLIFTEQCLQRASASSPWFSLSCQAFRTEVVDCTDGYTILVLPGRGDTEHKKVAGSQESVTKAYNRSPRCYVLWEYSPA
ncbi:MAG: hypothetical protein Q9172_002907 [Xanthocarpia lactea]